MRLSTDAFGTIYVKGQDVEHIETDKRLQIETVKGARYFGPLSEPDDSGDLTIQHRGQAATVAYEQVVHIQPIKSTRSGS